MKYYWGTPLEDLAFQLKVSIIFNDDFSYDLARKLYRAFIRVNPDFWADND